MKKHSFLSEELLVPGVNMCDTMRINMFDNHLLQTIVLAETTPPLVFTNFENQVGAVSSALKVAEDNLVLVARIPQTKLKETFLLANPAKKTIEIHVAKPCFWLTEHYGWKNKNHLSSLPKGAKIPKGSVISSNSSYDEHMNYGYGRNLNAIFLPYKNLTFEDAIVISESAAEKMATYNIHQIDITLNTNDILLNLYGDERSYKSFPNVGEDIKDKVLCARRRIAYNSVLAELRNNLLEDINLNTDTIFHSTGTIADIEIFCNQPIDELEKHKFFKQEVKILKNQERYNTALLEVIEQIQASKLLKHYKFSDDLNFEVNRANLALDTEKKWLNDNKEFSYLVYRFTIMERSPLTVGTKITNRYGGKGVISKILPDTEMPVNQHGERAEIILNVLGVINRTNIAQLIELEVNFISKELERYMSNPKLPMEKLEKIYFTYLKLCNVEQYTFTLGFYESLTNVKKKEFWDLLLLNGIHIHQPPFFHNINIDKLTQIYKVFEKILQPYQFEGILQPLIMGKMYYMRLKHDSFGKFSARSARYLNLKKVPAKSRSFKDSENLFSTTPLRLGRQNCLV